MKSKLTLLFAFATQLLFAQKTQVTTVTESIGGGSNAAYSVFIDNVEPKRAEKEWNSYLKQHDGKSASSKDFKDQVVFDNVKIAAIGSEPLKVFAKVIRDKDAIRITAAFAKPGSFISSSTDPGADRAVQKLMYDFAVNLKKMLVSEQLEDATDVQKKNKDKQKDLEGDIESSKKDIVGYQNRIIGAMQSITKDSTAVEEMKDKIQKQNEVLEKINQNLKDID